MKTYLVIIGPELYEPPEWVSVELSDTDKDNIKLAIDIMSNHHDVSSMNIQFYGKCCSDININDAHIIVYSNGIVWFVFSDKHGPDFEVCLDNEEVCV